MRTGAAVRRRVTCNVAFGAVFHYVAGRHQVEILRITEGEVEVGELHAVNGVPVAAGGHVEDAVARIQDDVAGMVKLEFVVAAGAERLGRRHQERRRSRQKTGSTAATRAAELRPACRPPEHRRQSWRRDFEAHRLGAIQHGPHFDAGHHGHGKIGRHGGFDAVVAGDQVGLGRRWDCRVRSGMESWSRCRSTRDLRAISPARRRSVPYCPGPLPGRNSPVCRC